MSNRPDWVALLPDNTEIDLHDVSAIGPITKCGAGDGEMMWFHLVLHSGAEIGVEESDLVKEVTLEHYREWIKKRWWEIIPI